MNKQIITEIEELIANNESMLSDYELNVLRSFDNQARIKFDLSEKQLNLLNRIKDKFTEQALAARAQWDSTFDEKKFFDMNLVATYYKSQGLYFLGLAERILSDPSYIPSPKAYEKICENKYAKKVISEHYREPKYDIGQMVFLKKEQQRRPEYRLLSKGGFIASYNAGPIVSHAKGSKPYLVLPIGHPDGIVVQERHLKTRR